VRLFLVGEIILLWEAIEQAIKARGLPWRVETASPTVALMAARHRIKADVVMLQARAGEAGYSQVAPLVQQDVKVVIVAIDEASEEAFLPALRQGAAGFLDRTASVEEVLACVRRVAQGEMHIPARLAARLAGEYRELALSQSGSFCLTSRELEILEQLAKGYSNRAIAAALYLSEHTVRAHLRNIMHKLNVENRVQAVARATSGGLLSAAAEAVRPPGIKRLQTA
jgi:DNA-binding NarL/FixJ family response regulator